MAASPPAPAADGISTLHLFHALHGRRTASARASNSLSPAGSRHRPAGTPTRRCSSVTSSLRSRAPTRSPCGSTVPRSSGGAATRGQSASSASLSSMPRRPTRLQARYTRCPLLASPLLPWRYRPLMGLPQGLAATGPTSPDRTADVPRPTPTWQTAPTAPSGPRGRPHRLSKRGPSRDVSRSSPASAIGSRSIAPPQPVDAPLARVFMAPPSLSRPASRPPRGCSLGGVRPP